MENVIYIYHSCIDNKDGNSISFKKDVLSEERKLALNLLSSALFELYGLSDCEILKTSEGKPYLSKHKDIHFSISHSRGVVFCAVSRINCGIDAEKIRDYDGLLKKISHRWFSGEIIKNGEDFFEVWTKAEAYGKFTGKGMISSLRDSERKTVEYKTEAINGYAVSVCCKEKFEISYVKK